jgi:four helix bundle protein
MQNYRRIKAWAKGHALLLNVHRALQRPAFRRFPSLRAQLRRSTESVPTNIVEGAGRANQKEFANYLQHSFSSCNEVEYQLHLAFDYGLISRSEWRALTVDTIEVRKMIFGLIKKVRGSG